MKGGISMGYSAKLYEFMRLHCIIRVVLPPKKYPVSSNIWKNIHFRNIDMKCLLFFYSLPSILQR